MVATIIDIAKMAGVSKTTVSKVLNNQYGVNADTREKVLKAARELNYVPNQAARSLVKNRSGVIGVLYDSFNASVYVELGEYIETFASKQGYNVVFANCNDKNNVKVKYADYFAGGAADGIILFGSDKNDEGIIKSLIEKNYPFVVIENHFENLKINNILIDNEQGARKAVNYLAQLGHKRIGHITGNISHRAASDRLNGYIKGLQDNSLEINPKYIFYTNGKQGSAGAIIDEISKMREEIRPTALFVFNDNLAYESMVHLNDKGYKVPEDFSVVGFDNIIEIIPFLPRTTKLTSMAQPIKDIAKNSIEMLVQNMENRELEPKELLFQTYLVEGKSCKNI